MSFDIKNFFLSSFFFCFLVSSVLSSVAADKTRVCREGGLEASACARVHMGMDLKNLKSVLVIAEIGQNHQGDIEVAKNVIKKKKVFSSALISD